jgi:uncharacterized protein HemY
MKNYLTMGILAAIAFSYIAPAQADEWRDSRRNDFRADRQEYRAGRDAAYGDFRGARHHMRRAVRDDYRAQRDQNRAWRHSF